MAPKITMSRIIGPTQNSNTLAPPNPTFAYAQFQYYTPITPYANTGAQEAIYLCDCNPFSVTLSPVSTMTAWIEGTDAPPDAVAGITTTVTPVWVQWPQGPVSVATTAIVQGFTAIRVNSTANATGINLSVRA